MKVRVLFLILTISFALVSGCSSIVGNPYEKIFSQLKKGNYSKAEETIQEQVLGNVQEEANAEQECIGISQQLLDDYNNGGISSEDVEIFIEAASRTSFDTYFEKALLQSNLYRLKESKEYYNEGITCLEQTEPNYMAATELLLKVARDDSNFPNAVENLNEIVNVLISVGNLEDLAIASEIGENLTWQSNFFPESFENFTNIEELRTGWIQAQLTYAKALDSNHRYAHAIRQYSRIKNVCQEAEERFVELQRRRNAYNFTGSGTYSIDPYGRVSLVEPPAHGYYWNWDERELDALQIGGDNDANSYGCDAGYVTILDSRGILDVIRPSSIPKEEWTKRGLDKLPQGSVEHVIKTCDYGDMNLAVMNDSGYLSTYGDISSEAREASTWEELVDFGTIRYNNDFYGITADGRVLTTWNTLKDVFSYWTNAISVSEFSLRDDIWTTTYYCCLKADGTISCVDEYGRVIEPGVVGITQIAGKYLLKESGELLKISSVSGGDLLLDPVETDNRVEMLFTCGKTSGSKVLAWCSDGSCLTLFD